MFPIYSISLDQAPTQQYRYVVTDGNTGRFISRHSSLRLAAKMIEVLAEYAELPASDSRADVLAQQAEGLRNR